MIELDGAAVGVGEITLLPPVSVRVRRGEALVVRGANGSGKSTLLRLLAGSRSPSSGDVRIGGVAPDGRDRGFRRLVAAMIGLPPLAPDLTVFDHLALVAATWAHTPDDVDRTVREVCDDLGLATLGHRFPHELSSGQTQLLALALVLVRPFDVLLLDEPEQRLDDDRVDVLVQVLDACRAAGATLVLSTHSPELAERIADRTLTLGDAP